MKIWASIISLFALTSFSAFAAPTLSFTTDAPGNNASSGLYFVKGYVATDLYPGLITLTVVDDGTIAALNPATATGTSPFHLVGYKDQNVPVSTSAIGESTKIELNWGSSIEYVSVSGSTYTFRIKSNAVGTEGLRMYVAFNLAVDATRAYSSNYAYIMKGLWLDNPILINPVSVNNEDNYLGRSTYSLKASGNYGDITSNLHILTGSSVASGNTEAYSINFYGNNADSSWNSSSTLLATGILSSNVATATADFSTSGNRLKYIKAIAFDAAGNQKDVGATTTDLNVAQWVALGQFKDSGLTTWAGNATVANEWTTSNYLTAGNTVDLKFYAVDYYGNLVSSANSADNVVMVSSKVTANTAFDGSTAPDTTIDTGTTIALASGVTTYSGCVTFYRQENVTLGAEVSGEYWPTKSSNIAVRHNKIQDIVYYRGYVTGSSATGNVNNLDSTGMGFSSKSGNAFSDNAIAGSGYTVELAMLDVYQNLCLYDTAGTNTITFSDNTTSGFTANSYATNYSPYSGTYVTHTETYPNSGSAITISSNTASNSGIITVAGTTLYVAESGNLQQTSTITSDSIGTNSYNNDIVLKVDMATSKVVYFDDDATYTNGLLMASGNNFTAGGNKVLYAHVTDLYGNKYTSDSSSITISSGANNSLSSSTTTTSSAYRNDASTLAGSNTLTATASSGTATFGDVRFDRATVSGNTTYYPYLNLYLTYSAFTGSTAIVNSPALTVSANTTSNVYFVNSSLEPISGSNVITSPVAGQPIYVKAAIGDGYGNIDLVGTGNTIGLKNGNEASAANLLSTALDNTAVSMSGNSYALSGAGNAHLMMTGYKAETGRQISVIANNLTGEDSAYYTVGANTITQVSFTNSSGVYGTGNIISGQTAGTAFTVNFATLDAYLNLNTSNSTSTYSFTTSSTNSINHSPNGDDPALSSKTGTFSSGLGSQSITLYDAEAGVELVLATNAVTTSSANSTSNKFDVGFASANIIKFLSTDYTNETFFSTSTSANTALSSSKTATITAGANTSLKAAIVDQYGNLITNSSDSLTVGPGTTAPGTSSGGNAFSYTGATAIGTDGIVDFVVDLYKEETGAQVKIHNAGNTAWGSVTATYTVSANTATDARFTDSSGTYYASDKSIANMIDFNSSSPNTTTAPIAAAGTGIGIDGIYVGFYDGFGNKNEATTGNINVSGNNATTVSAPTTALDIATYKNTNGVVYFDPANSSKKVTNSSDNLITGTSLLTVWTNASNSGTNNYSNRFKVSDVIAPAITVNYPNGGEKLYPGTFNIGWSASDSNLTSGTSGNLQINLSVDGGLTWGDNLQSTSDNNNAATTFAWTISSANLVSTDKARIRVRVWDDAGNMGEDISDANFSIAPATSVISYVVADPDGTSATVFFRENVYSSTGGALGTDAFAIGSSLSLSSVAHTAGTSSAVLTFASAIGTSNINSAAGNIGLIASKVSPNTNSADVYTTTTQLAGQQIRQLVSSEATGISYKMTSSSNQQVLGMKLVGWTTGNTLMKVNAKINTVSGVVSASDFEALALEDAGGNTLASIASASLSIDSTLELVLNSGSGNSITTTAIASSSANNYFLKPKTSATISDSVPDAFSVSVESVEIYDTTLAVNVIHSLVGTKTTTPIVTDVTAPTAPVLTYDSIVNATESANVSLTISAEAGANVTYAYGSMSNTVVMPSGNGSTSTTVYDSLATLADGNVIITAYAVDALGNNGNTQGLVTTETLYKDTTSIVSTDVSVVLNNASTSGGNLTSLNTSAAGVSITLTSPGETQANYSLTLTDGTTSLTYTGAFGVGANVVTLTGLDLSTLSDGTLTASLTLTDSNGNETSSFTGKTVSIDKTAPTVGALTLSDSLFGSSEVATGLTITAASLSEAATVKYTLTGPAGNTITASTLMAASASSFSVASGINLSTLADGIVSVSVMGTDSNGNQGTAVTSSFELDATASPAPVLSSPISGAAAIPQPTFVWSAVTDGVTYKLYLSGGSMTANTMLTSGSATSYTYASANLTNATYSWSVNVIDDAGNETASTTETFVVNLPSAPVLGLPSNAASVVAMPNLSWNPVDSAKSYDVVVQDASLNTVFSSLAVTGTSVTVSTALAAGSYTWSVRTNDIYSLTGAYSASQSFSVVIPSIDYVISDVGSTKAIAVFDSGVFSANDGTGAIDAGDFGASALDGVSEAIHVSGESMATLNFVKSLTGGNTEATDINSANIMAAANAIYNITANPVSPSMTTIRQVAFGDNVTSTEALVYGGDAKTIGQVKLRAWGAGGNLDSLSYVISSVYNTVESSDFTGNVSLYTESGTLISSTVSGNFGETQVLTPAFAAALSSDTSSAFMLKITAGSAQTATMDMAKVFKVAVKSVDLSVNHMASKSYKVAGDSETSEVIFSNVTIDSTDISSTGNDASIQYTVGQTITIAASPASGSAAMTWSQVSGVPQSIIVGSSPSIMTFSPTAAGQYEFELSYMLDGYKIVVPMSSKITIKTAEEADVVGKLVSGTISLSSAEDFKGAVELMSSYTGGIASADVAANLVNASSQILSQIATDSSGAAASITTEQAESFVKVIDEASSTSNVDKTAIKSSVLSSLNNVKALPALSEEGLSTSFKVLASVSSVLTPDEVLETSTQLSSAVLKSLNDSGKKSFQIDAASNIKTSVTRIYEGQVNTLGLDDGEGQAVSIQVPQSVLSQVSGAAAITATAYPETGVSVVTSNGTGSQVSGVYEINIVDSTGSALSVKNLTEPLTVSLKLDKTPAADKVYTIWYRESASGAWIEAEGTVNLNGKEASVTVNHLTQFTVVEAEKPVEVTPAPVDDGGGCLLKF